MIELRLFARRAVLATTLVASAVGCSSGTVGSVPAQKDGVIPGSNAVLQFAVGTATVGLTAGNCYDKTAPPFYGLNVMETFRQPSGASAVLYDTPSVSGPPGFVGDSANGAPTATISNAFGGYQTSADRAAGVQITETGSVNELGAFGFGFAGESLISSGPVYEQSALPAFDYTQKLCARSNVGIYYPKYVGGPPAWPAVNNGLFPNFGTNGFGFVGYNMGFFDYLSTPAAIPPTGTYTLDVAIPVGAGTTSAGVLTGGPASVTHVAANASLASNAPLPLFPKPSATTDPAHPGGLLITASVPSGVTQAFAEVAVTTQGLNSTTTTLEYYTIALPVTSPGAPVTVALPANLGIPLANSSTPTATVPPGSSYTVSCVGFDYDALGASYPRNTSQRPSIAGPNGQADITTSDVFNGSSS